MMLSVIPRPRGRERSRGTEMECQEPPRGAIRRRDERTIREPLAPSRVRQAVGRVRVRLLGAPFAVLIDALSFVVSALFITRIRAKETDPASAGERAGIIAEIGE